METLVFIVMLLISFGIYFLPSFVANSNKHKNLTGIILLNLLLGWTFLGWVIALVWSVQVQDKLSEIKG